MNHNRTWDDYLNEVEAEIEGHDPAPSAAELRHETKQEARRLANSIRIDGRTGTLPAPSTDDTSAKDLANRVTVNGRTGGEPPKIKRAARYIDPLER